MEAGNREVSQPTPISSPIKFSTTVQMGSLFSSKGLGPGLTRLRIGLNWVKKYWWGTFIEWSQSYVQKVEELGVDCSIFHCFFKTNETEFHCKAKKIQQWNQPQVPWHGHGRMPLRKEGGRHCNVLNECISEKPMGRNTGESSHTQSTTGIILFKNEKEKHKKNMLFRN